MLARHGAIEAAHIFILTGPFRGSHRATEIRRVTYLIGTIALLDLNARVTGFVGLQPGLRATAPGLILTRERWIVEKRDGEWRLLRSQGTPVPPAP